VRARLLVLVAIVNCTFNSTRVLADPWSIQPLIGLGAQYSSNPVLVANEVRSEANAALFVNSPINYDEDAFHFAAVPNLRYSSQSGYSSVTSDYYHLDTSAQFSNELGALNLTESLYRDSSLFYAGGLANGIGVRRDTSTSDINWQHSFTERAQLQVDLATSRVLFQQSQLVSGLVDYRYSSASPSYAYQINERDSLRLVGGVSRYYSLNSLTSSQSENLQLGYDHKLSELWTITATYGYAKSNNSCDFIYFGYFLGVDRSTENGAVYSINSTRQDEHLSLNFAVSRALTPTGLAFLTRQDRLSIGGSYAESERWSYGGSITWQALRNPVQGGGSTEAHYFSANLSATWHWTEQWLATLSATRIAQSYDAPSVSAASTGVSLQISRQFYRTNN
jgi:hypothetical protein